MSACWTLTAATCALCLTATLAQAQPEWEQAGFQFEGEGATTLEKTDEAETAGGGLREEPEEPTETALEPALLAGFGIGTRSLRYPLNQAPAKTDTGAYPTLELGIELGFRRSPAFRYGLRAHYRTSAGLRVEEARVASVPRSYRARSHQVRGGVFLVFALGSHVELDTALDYDARNFHSIVPDVQTPSYTLSGPLLSLGLTVRMLDARLWLRLAPEVQAILQVGDQLKHRGASSAGIAGGGDVALGVRIHGNLGCELAYFESRARVGSGDDGVRDAARYMTVRLRGSL